MKLFFLLYLGCGLLLILRPIELSLVGQNIFDNWHQEFSAGLGKTPSEIGRSVYGKVTLDF